MPFKYGTAIRPSIRLFLRCLYTGIFQLPVEAPFEIVILHVSAFQNFRDQLVILLSEIFQNTLFLQQLRTTYGFPKNSSTLQIIYLYILTVGFYTATLKLTSENLFQNVIDSSRVTKPGSSGYVRFKYLKNFSKSLVTTFEFNLKNMSQIYLPKLKSIRFKFGCPFVHSAARANVLSSLDIVEKRSFDDYLKQWREVFQRLRVEDSKSTPK